MPDKNSKKTTGKTKKGGNVVSQKISTPKYNLILGFEVNYIATAFKNDIHDIWKDVGHAFFYITKNDEVISFFSFGPYSMDDPNRTLIDSKLPSKATLKLKIIEISNLFKINNIPEKDVSTILINIYKMRSFLYSPVASEDTHRTCASAAVEVLTTNTSLDIPSGRGRVIVGAITKIPTKNLQLKEVYIINPYMWYKNCLAKYGKEKEFTLKNGLRETANLETTGEHRGIKLIHPWYLAIGTQDPLTDPKLTGKY